MAKTFKKPEKLEEKFIRHVERNLAFSKTVNYGPEDAEQPQLRIIMSLDTKNFWKEFKEPSEKMWYEIAKTAGNFLKNGKFGSGPDAEKAALGWAAREYEYTLNHMTDWFAGETADAFGARSDGRFGRFFETYLLLTQAGSNPIADLQRGIRPKNEEDAKKIENWLSTEIKAYGGYELTVTGFSSIKVPVVTALSNYQKQVPWIEWLESNANNESTSFQAIGRVFDKMKNFLTARTITQKSYFINHKGKKYLAGRDISYANIASDSEYTNATKIPNALWAPIMSTIKKYLVTNEDEPKKSPNGVSQYLKEEYVGGTAKTRQMAFWGEYLAKDEMRGFYDASGGVTLDGRHFKDGKERYIPNAAESTDIIERFAFSNMYLFTGLTREKIIQNLKDKTNIKIDTSLKKKEAEDIIKKEGSSVEVEMGIKFHINYFELFSLYDNIYRISSYKVMQDYYMKGKYSLSVQDLLKAKITDDLVRWDDSDAMLLNGELNPFPADGRIDIEQALAPTVEYVDDEAKYENLPSEDNI